MTDREEFEKFLKDNFLYDTSGFIQNEAERKKAQDESFVWRAWQARGELERLKAETQEPMIIKQENGMVLKLGYDELPNGTAFYTTPSREWVGLSYEEIGRLAVFDGLHHVEIPLLAKFIIAIEKALREKNNG